MGAGNSKSEQEPLGCRPEEMREDLPQLRVVERPVVGLWQALVESFLDEVLNLRAPLLRAANPQGLLRCQHRHPAKTQTARWRAV